MAHKNFTPEDRKRSSTWQELETILFALHSFLPFISNSRAKLFTDNQAAAKIIETGSMKCHLHELAFEIFDFCLKNLIRLEVDWIPHSLNDQADYISKLIVVDDWCLSEVFFETINTEWGPFTIDCFATYYNTKLPCFFSRFWNPGALAVDAFAQDWSAENALLVPLLTLIPSVLSSLQSCHGTGVLVFPWWPSSPFWPLLWTIYKPFIHGVVTMPRKFALVHRRNINSLLGSSELKSMIAAVKLELSQVS